MTRSGSPEGEADPRRAAAAIRAEFARLGDPGYAEGAKRVIGPDARVVGLHGGKDVIKEIVRGALAAEPVAPAWEWIAPLADALLESGVYEEGQAAILALRAVRRQWPDAQVPRFTRWLGRGVDNWAVCDSLCIGVISPWFEKYPARLPEIAAWENARSTWLRRAAIVVWLRRTPALGAKATAEAARLVDAGLARGEAEPIVHKALGWWLKDCVACGHAREVEALLVARGAALSPDLVRIATEKLSRAARGRVREARAQGRVPGRRGA